MLCLFSLALASCGGEDYPCHPWDWDEDETPVENNPTIVQQGWTPITNLGKLPDYLQVYKSPEMLEGNRAVAYIAVADMKKAKFELLGDVDYSEQAESYVGTLSTPSAFYEQSKCPVVINAGLFYVAEKNGKNYNFSQNLFVRNGKLQAINQNYYSKDWVTMWYPTLGAFCQLADGTFRTAWTYYSNNDQKNYFYSQPASNDIDKTPLQVPDANFPVSTEDLQVVNAIGGVSVLLRQGTIRNTYVEEMLDVSAASNQPRTAIGSTADGKMILFVCEGRNKTAGVFGLSTAKVAVVMKNLGCIEALNLDGGGSSCMLVNGHETIKCSDGKQRKVLTAIGLK